MTNKYFSSVSDYATLRKQYTQLVKTMHPDCGGNTSDFQEMQAEYEAMAKSFGKDKKTAHQDMANAWGFVRGMRVIYYGYAMNSHEYVVTRATAEGCELAQVGTPCNGVDFFEYDDTVQEVEDTIYQAHMIMNKAYDHVKPLSKKFGIGIYWDDVEGKTYTEEETKAAELRAENVKKYGELAKADRQRKADEAAKAAELAELAIINEWRARLEVIPAGAKDATKKAILKRNIKAVFAYYFPGVKVTVKDTNKVYQEDSRICWVDGPTVEEVEKVEAFEYFRAYGWAAPDPCEDYGHRTTRHSLQKFREMFGAFSDDKIDFERTLSPDAEAVINAALDVYEFEGRDSEGRISQRTGTALLTWSDIEAIATACGLENIHNHSTRTKGAERLISYCLHCDAGDNKMRVYRSRLTEIIRECLKVNKPTAPKAEKVATDTPQPEQVGEVLAEADGVQLVATDKGAQFIGNTYEHKAEIKAMGARWYRLGSCWTIKAEQIAEAVELVKSWEESEAVATDEPTTEPTNDQPSESATECPQVDEVATDEPTTEPTPEDPTEGATDCPAWAAAFVDMVDAFADALHIATSADDSEAVATDEPTTEPTNDQPSESATQCPQADEVATDEPTTEPTPEEPTEGATDGAPFVIRFSPDDCPDLPELRDVEPTPPTEPRQPLSDEEAARVARIFKRYADIMAVCEEENDHTEAVKTYGRALVMVLRDIDKLDAACKLLDELDGIDRAHAKRGNMSREDYERRNEIARIFCAQAIDYAGHKLAALLFGSYMVDDVRGAA